MLRNGNATAALEITRAAEHRYRPDSEDNWRARLLEAEILLRDDQVAQAGKALSTEPPQAGRFGRIAARRTWLLGEFELSNGRADSAEAYLERAGRMAQTAGAWDVTFEAQASRAKLLFVFRRDTKQATELFQALANAAAERHSAYYQAVALLGMGMIRLKQSRFDEAIPWFQRAMAAARSEAAQRLIVAAGQNLAICYSQLGSFDEALKSRQDAVNLLGDSGLVPYRMQLLGEMGSTYLLQNDVTKAIDFYRRALSLARTESDTARWYRTLAAAYVSAQDWDAAEQSNNLSLQRQNDDASRPWVEKNAAAIAEGRGRHAEAAELYRQAIRNAKGDPVIIWESHAALARIFAEERKFPQANHEFEQAIDIIDRNVNTIATQGYKLTFFSMLIRFYQSYVRALVEQQAYDRALEVADSSRARILQQRLALSAKSSAPAPRPDFPKLARSTGSVLLFYWIAPEKSYLWVVTPAGIRRPFELPPAGQIRRWVDEYRDFVEQQVGDPISGGGQTGRQLYEALIAPAASLIPRGSRVILVPDDALNWLNFETLPVSDGNQTHYWIEDAVSMIAPSLSALSFSRPARRQSPDSLLMIGDPVSPSPEFPKLDYASKEMDAIATKFAPERRARFAGALAKPSIYKASSPEHYALLHFSAHAVSNKESPLDSAIILSSENGNYKLYARDIMDTPLTASLVTISACRSAGARTYSGEGLVGFAWGFLQAGARNVIAGLWDVTDSSTPEMMNVLYSRIAVGEAPAEGLRHAKLALLRSASSYRKPYYWGALETYGRGF